jgi:hypothetical protein
MTSAAFAAGIFPVTPNFDGMTKPAGSTLPISWTSTLAPGETLELWQTIYGPGNMQSSTNLVGGLPATGSYVVTIPSEAVGKTVGYRLQTATWSSYGSSIMGGVNGPWQINVVPGPPATGAVYSNESPANGSTDHTPGASTLHFNVASALPLMPSTYRVYVDGRLVVARQCYLTFDPGSNRSATGTVYVNVPDGPHTVLVSIQDTTRTPFTYGWSFTLAR